MNRTTRFLLGVVAAACVTIPAAAAAQVRNWPSESAPRPLAAKPVKFPPYQLRTLANGLRVVVVEHHEQPVVSSRVLVGAGWAQDTAPKIGVANLVASLLDQGTPSRNARQIADAVDMIGGRLTVAAGRDAMSASVTVLKDTVEQGLDVLSDVVRSPAFVQDELDRQRDQVKSALRVDLQDPERIATLVFQRLVYGSHPYGFPGTGTLSSLDLITRADLQEFHQRYFVPNNCVVAVVGDIAPAEAFAAVEASFGTWLPGEIGQSPIASPPEPARRLVVVDVPGAVQAEIRVGQLGLPRKHNDHMALDLAIRVLGGEGVNRLQGILRAQRGLTYDASADLGAYRLGGSIVAETGTAPQSTGEALRVILNEFRRLQRDAADERELEAAKAFLAGSFPLGIETPGDIASKILAALFYGLPLEELDTFRERVNAVSLTDLQRVTRAYLNPDRLSVVLVGDVSILQVPISELRLGEPEIIPLADLDVTSPDLHRQRASRPGSSLVPSLVVLPRTSREEWERTKDVLERAAVAAGGLDALRAVRTLRMTATTVMPTPDGPVSTTTRTSIEYPARIRVDIKLPKSEVVQVYADGRAWVKDQTGPHDAPEPMRQEFARAMRRDWIPLLLAAAEDRVLGARLADATGVAGRPLQVVELSGEDLEPVRIAIDSSSAQLAWVSYTVNGPDGRSTITESFGDIRPVGGIRFPFTTVVRRDSMLVLERTVTSVEVNVTLAPTLFDKLQ